MRATMASQRAMIEWKPLVGGQRRVGLTATSTGASSVSVHIVPASEKARAPACSRSRKHARWLSAWAAGQHARVAARA